MISIRFRWNINIYNI